MSEPVKLSETISEIMSILTRRREIETRIREGTASKNDFAELETINRRLQQ